MSICVDGEGSESEGVDGGGFESEGVDGGGFESEDTKFEGKELALGIVNIPSY